ncbi:hypothetical protein H5410_034742 [Solanum commersonii]|uniref:Uncharacterized protein n=1 Tax=Solanum commersonii TaxID=4109 RepID=A0A9J5YWC4_SOLCO|nr:hypothetical protein H5410_034742 [Solanum commersonii]
MVVRNNEPHIVTLVNLGFKPSYCLVIVWCVQCLQQVKHEYFLVKNKLETLMRLEKQILAAGGMIPDVS